MSSPVPSVSPRRDGATFHAWVAAAVPRAFLGLPPLPRAAVRAAWDLAAREIAARLALACAREGLVAADLDTELRLRTRAGVMHLPIAHRGGFDLHRPDLDAPGDPALAHPWALLATLPLAPMTAARISDELADSVFHLAVARVIAELRVRARLTSQPWPAPLDPENLVIAGHPWHPMCKTRLGLHLHEVLRFAPEGLAAPQVFAVDVAAALVAVSPGFLDMSGRLFAAPPAGLVRVPVHALQRRRLPRLLGALWGAGVRPAPAPPRRARALLSLRTVAVADLHVKLSTDMHTTSARRQVSPMSSHNGPRLGALISAIAVMDPRTGQGLQLQPEPAAAGLDPRALGAQASVAGQLGAIFRPAVATLVDADAVAWVCAALGERWPGDPAELVAHDPEDMSPRPRSPVPNDMSHETALLHRQVGDPLLRAICSAYPTPLAALQRYIDLLVPPSLRLLTAHGVALELHLQNTLVVHRRGELRGFLVRDLGGVRLHRGRLAAAGHRPGFAEGSFIVTEDLAETQTKLAHTLLHAHLGTVFAWAADLLGLEEAALWAHTRAVIAGLLRAWALAEPRLAAACAADEAALLAPQVRAKALLRMRLDERVSDYAYTQVANPLARADRGGSPVQRG